MEEEQAAGGKMTEEVREEELERIRKVEASPEYHHLYKRDTVFPPFISSFPSANESTATGLRVSLLRWDLETPLYIKLHCFASWIRKVPAFFYIGGKEKQIPIQP